MPEWAATPGERDHARTRCAALLEGPAYFFLIAYLIEGMPWALAGGLLFGALLAILTFPTRERVEAWLAVQREALEQERLGL